MVTFYVNQMGNFQLLNCQGVSAWFAVCLASTKELAKQHFLEAFASKAATQQESFSALGEIVGPFGRLVHSD